MTAPIHDIVVGTGRAMRDMVRHIRDINRKYATPHIKTTRLVRVCLLMLRGYLLLLVAILVYRFISVLR